MVTRFLKKRKSNNDTEIMICFSNELKCIHLPLMHLPICAMKLSFENVVKPGSVEFIRGPIGLQSYLKFDWKSSQITQIDTTQNFSYNFPNIVPVNYFARNTVVDILNNNCNLHLVVSHSGERNNLYIREHSQNENSQRCTSSPIYAMNANDLMV